jgi:DNA repair protein SbcD/Mre11
LQPFRFIHTADLHLDSPCVGMRAISGELQKQLQESTFLAFERIVELCLEHQVDFLTIAGDIYDGADRSLRAQIFFREQVRRLEEHGIRVFVIHGNHDHLGGQITSLKWPDNVHVFPAGHVSSAAVYRDGEEIARVYGISYPKQAVTERYVNKFQKEADAPYAVALLHTNVGDLSEHANYAPATVEELERAGMDFWGLGHIHVPKLLKDQNPVILYPGNPQGRHIREAGERGCYLVEVDSNYHTTLTFLPTQQVRWTEMEIPLQREEQEGELLDRIVQEINQTMDEASETQVIRLRITGQGSLHSSLQSREFLLQFQESLQTMLDLCTLPVWVESIQVNTSPAFNLEELRMQPNFIGDFLSIRERLEKDPSALQEMREAVRDLFGSGRPLPELDDQTLERLLRRAELLGLQMLLEVE